MMTFPCSFSNIVIAGGAVKTLSSIGCIQYLEDVDILKHIKNFLGTSAGSILCLFTVLGYSAKEIIAFVYEQFQKDEIVQLDIEEALLMFERYGISSGSNLTKFVSDMIKAKLNKTDITFLELAKATGKNLIVCVANITDEQEEFWSVDSTPHMSVAFAIRTSCSLPFIFTPMKYKDKYYVDGGLYNNFPINYFYTDILKDVIGINVISKSSMKREMSNFFDYVNIIFTTAIKHLAKPYKDDLKNNVVTLELHDEPWISFTDMRLALPKCCLDANVLLGYEQIKKRMQIHCENIEELMTKTLQNQQ